ncbi:MAG: sodium:calcium exchanger [Cyanobacteria bacterium P01_H01_bin.21]
MSLVLWSLALLGAILSAHWGADKLSVPLQKMRKQWGLSEAAGAAFVALATASPEVGTNTASAIKGLSDIGLGNLLGSNIISVPAIVTVAYLANRTRTQGSQSGDSWHSPLPDRHLLRVKQEALTVQALPYIGVIGIAALLTLPPPWRGLQPMDGYIMLGVYGLYLIQAIFRKREQRHTVSWSQQEIWVAIAGILALSFGAYLTVTATEKIVSILGISQLIGGLFITSTLSIAPEVFATWSVARSGQVTAATASVIADNTATMSLALVPLALVETEIQDLTMFMINLGFVALFAAAYGGLVHWGDEKGKYSFELWEVACLIGLYGVYLVVILGVIL